MKFNLFTFCFLWSIVCTNAQSVSYQHFLHKANANFVHSLVSNSDSVQIQATIQRSQRSNRALVMGGKQYLFNFNDINKHDELYIKGDKFIGFGNTSIGSEFYVFADVTGRTYTIRKSGSLEWEVVSNEEVLVHGYFLKDMNPQVLEIKLTNETNPGTEIAKVLAFYYAAGIINNNALNKPISKVQAGIKAGLNASIFNATFNSNSSALIGPNLGVFIKLHMEQHLYFRTELYYSRIGQKDQYVSPFGGTVLGNTTTTLNYFNIPLMFETGERVSALGGLQFGFLLNAHEKGTISGKQVDFDLVKDMNKTDLALVAGINVQLTRNIDFGGRLQLALTSIFNDRTAAPPGGVDIKYRMLHGYIAVSF